MTSGFMERLAEGPLLVDEAPPKDTEEGRMI